MQSMKTHKERNMLDLLYNSNHSLNKALDLDEVRKVIKGMRFIFYG